MKKQKYLNLAPKMSYLGIVAIDLENIADFKYGNIVLKFQPKDTQIFSRSPFGLVTLL